MEITDIQFRHLHDEGRLKALVSVTFDQTFAVHDIKIIDGQERLFLAMPSRRMPDGRYRDIVHPVGSMMREKMEREVLAQYQNSIQNGEMNP
ncbi:MAG: septation regulator SpoVG [Butyricicoccaceae bacterium]